MLLLHMSECKNNSTMTYSNNTLDFSHNNAAVDFEYLDSLSLVERDYVMKDAENYIWCNSENGVYYSGWIHSMMMNIHCFYDYAENKEGHLPEIIYDALLHGQILHIARVSYCIEKVVYDMNYSGLECEEIDYLYNKRYDNTFDYMINYATLESVSCVPSHQMDIKYIYQSVIDMLSSCN